MQRRKQAVRPRRPKDSKKSQRRNGSPPLTVHRRMDLVPERLRVVMDHTAVLTLLNSGSKQANYVWRPSSIYDVDPSIGGATCYGYTEYANFYSQYRVIKSTIRVLASNQDSDSAALYVVASQGSPGNNAADMSPYFSHPNARMIMLGPNTGNPAATLTHSCTTQAISGVSTFAEDTYTGQFGSSPANNWFWNVGIDKAYLNMTYGVALVVKLKIEVDLFDRKVLETSLSSVHRIGEEVSDYPSPIPVYMVNPPLRSPPDPERARGTGPATGIQTKTPL